VQDVVEDEGGDVAEADHLVGDAANQSAADNPVGIEFIDKRIGRADDIEVEVPDVHGISLFRLLAVLIHVMAVEGLREAVGGARLLLNVVDIGETVAQGGAADEDVLGVDLLQVGEG